MRTVHPPDLTDTERALVDAVAKGQRLTCSPPPPATPAAADNLPAVRAEIIRAILRGRLGDDPDPRGLRLRGARITGRLDIRNAQCAIGLQLEECILDEPVAAQAGQIPWLSLTRTIMAGLIGDNLQVSGSVYFHNCTVTGTSHIGLIRLPHAHIGSNLEFDGTKMRNDGGPVLVADGLRIDGSLFLREGFHAKGSSGQGLVWLHSAHIGGAADFHLAHIRNNAGPAIVAEGIQVGGHMMFLDFAAMGTRNTVNTATIRITTAKIDGGLNLRAARVLNRTGPAIDLRSTSVNLLALPADVACRSGDQDPQTWIADGLLQLDGLTYSTLHPDSATRDQWRQMLRDRTASYAAQPYQQLAATYRAAGHEADARNILIAQQKDLRARGQLGGRAARALHLMQGVFLGYGYRSWRALACLLGVAALAVALGLAAGHTRAGPHRYLATQPSAAGQVGTPCSTTQQIALGIDIGIPLIKTSLAQQCQINTSDLAGQMYTAAAWLLQILAWAFATIFIAGYTGLVRKI